MVQKCWSDGCGMCDSFVEYWTETSAGQLLVLSPNFPLCQLQPEFDLLMVEKTLWLYTLLFSAVHNFMDKLVSWVKYFMLVSIQRLISLEAL